jgi:MHS family alpha-ketoglutarate permease-like MFS transporter
MSEVNATGEPKVLPADPNPQRSEPDRLSPRARKAVQGAWFGLFVDYFDIYLPIVALAPAIGYFMAAGLSPSVTTTFTFALFAAAFLGRPIGTFVFGHFGDRVGRKRTTLIAASGVTVTTFVAALLPGYAAAGVWSLVLLTAVRLVGGVFMGGQYTSANPLAIEGTPRRLRGKVGGIIAGAYPLAYVMISLITFFLLAGLNGGASAGAYQHWGWRIPFVIGALLAVVAAVMRRHLQETDAFKALQTSSKPRESSIRALLKYPREVLLVVGLTAGGTAAFYTYTTYMQKFLKLSVGLTDNQVTMVTAGSLIFAMTLQPIYGMISDRIGRKWLLIGFGVCGTLFTVPLLTTLQHVQSASAAFLLICAAWMIVSGYTSINAVVKAELFPTNVRATGVGLPYAITVSVFGGTADSVALWFKSQGHEQYFYYYLTGIIALSLVVYLFMRDTKHHSAMHRTE